MEEQKKRKSDFVEETKEKRNKSDEPDRTLIKTDISLEEFSNKHKDDLLNFGVLPDFPVSDKNDDKVKLQVAEEKHQINLQSIKQHREYINKQKQKIQDLKEQLRNYEFNNDDKTTSIEEITQYHNTLQKRIIDIKKQINKVRDFIESLRKPYYEIKFATNFEVKEVEEMEQRIKLLESEKNKVESEIIKQNEELNEVSKVYEQKIIFIGAEKQKLQKLMEDEHHKFKKEREIRLELVKDLSQANEMYRSLNLQTTKKSQELKNIKNKLEKDLQNKEEEFNELKSKIDQLSNNLMKLNQATVEPNDKINSLNQLIENKEEEILNNDLIKLRGDIVKKDEEILFIQNKFTEDSKKIKNLTGDLTKMIENNSKDNDKINNLEQIVQSKKEEFEMLVKDNENSHRIYTQNLIQIETLEKELEQFEINKEKLYTELNDEKKLIMSKDGDFCEFVSKIQKLELEVDAKYNETKKLILEKEKFITERNEEIDVLQKEIENLKHTLENNNTIIKDLSSDENNLKTENEILNNKYDKIERRKQSAKQKRDKIKTELDVLMEFNVKLKDKLNERKSELNILLSDKSVIEKSSFSDLSNNENINKLREQIGVLKFENENLKTSNLETSKENLGKILKEKDDIIRELKEKIAWVSLSNDSLQPVEKELKDLNKKCANMKDTLQKKNIAIKKSEDELAKAENELNGVQFKVSEYKEKTESLKEKYNILQEKLRTKTANNIEVRNRIRKAEKGNIIQSHQAFMRDTQKYIEDIKPKSQETVTDITKDNLNTLMHSRILMTNVSRLSQQNDEFSTSQDNLNLINPEIQEFFNQTSGKLHGQNKENDNMLILLDDAVNALKKDDSQANITKLDKLIPHRKSNEHNWGVLSCEEKFDILLSQSQPISPNMHSQEKRNQEEKAKTSDSYTKNVKTYSKTKKRSNKM